MTDDMLVALAKNGGVAMVNFYPVFLSDDVAKASKEREERLKPEIAALKAKDPSEGTEYQEGVYAKKLMAANPLPKVSWTVIVDHIDHMVKVAGIDHVGIGSDFDGIPAVPEGMEDVSKLPAILARAEAPRLQRSDIRKIMGENFMRVFAEAERGRERAAGRSRRKRPRRIVRGHIVANVTAQGSVWPVRPRPPCGGTTAP